MIETKRTDIRKELFDWAQCLVASLILVILVFTFLARIISVEGTSMTDTLQNHDRIVISNLFYKPGHGDVVVFTKPGYPSENNVEPLIKRVIAMGGDEIRFDQEGDFYTVAVKYKGDDGFVTLNELDGGPYQIKGPMRSIVNLENYPMTIPEGQLFVMGDNRNGSRDSRAPDIGLIDERSVMGRLLFRLWPSPGGIPGGW